MRRYIRHLRSTPQVEALPGSDQVPNSAGGYAWQVDPWTRLTRFLILGSEGGTYYVNERSLTRESAACVLECLVLDPKRTVETTQRVSTEGRAPSNSPALFALALAFCEPRAVPFAKPALVEVARTGTHLFEFLTVVRALRGFGRALRGAVADWYLSKSVDALAYQMVKYRQREGWTHRDALRLAHPKDADRSALLAWAVGKEAGDLPRVVQGFVTAQNASVSELPAFVREYRLTHEMLPSEALTDARVLEALSAHMPLTALVRFLGRLSRAGVLFEGSPLEAAIVARLADVDALRRARLHPVALLVAQRTYASGRGRLGKLAWPVSGRVVDALNGAFHAAFQIVEPSGKRVLLAVDVSGSMSSPCAGATALSCAEGAAALALVTAATEQRSLVKAFSAGLVDFPISPRQRLDDVLAAAGRMTFGTTDCAAPMVWAKKGRVAVDAFVILTDSETWFGDVHPRTALEDYRKAMKIEARLIVIAMAGNRFSIADPSDPLSLDVVGFDTSTPRVLTDFIAGR